MLRLLAGAAAGVLSGWGVGGGTLLMLFMTGVMRMAQAEAQSVNLLYFLPTSAAALPSHFKNGFVEKPALLPAVLCGAATAAAGALAASAVSEELLRRLFGVLLIAAGLPEIFYRAKGDGD